MVQGRELLRSLGAWLAGKPRTLAGAIVLMAMMLFASAGWAAWFAYGLTSGLPGKAQVSGLGDMAQATTIYDARNSPVFTFFKEQRLEVPLARISPNLIKAVISVEDQRFYEHSGVDPIRVAAAVLHNLHQ